MRVSHEMSCRIFRRGLRRAQAKERQAKGGGGVGVGVPHKTMCKLCDSRHAQWGKGRQNGVSGKKKLKLQN